jgi:hypothetical protein
MNHQQAADKLEYIRRELWAINAPSNQLGSDVESEIIHAMSCIQNAKYLLTRKAAEQLDNATGNG